MRKPRVKQTSIASLTEDHLSSEGFLDHSVVALPDVHERYRQLYRESAQSRRERLRTFVAEHAGKLVVAVVGRIEQGSSAASNPDSAGNVAAARVRAIEAARGRRRAGAMNKATAEYVGRPDVRARETELRRGRIMDVVERTGDLLPNILGRGRKGDGIPLSGWLNNEQVQQHLRGEAGSDPAVNALELAKKTLGSRLVHRGEDGTVELFSSRANASRTALYEQHTLPLSTIRESEADYAGQVVNVLSGFGFVGQDNKRGNNFWEVNGEWGETKEIRTVRIPFDETNELHAGLLSEGASGIGRELELVMSNSETGHGTSYLAVQLAPVLAQAVQTHAPLAMAA